jgi:hypothetical protein
VSKVWDYDYGTEKLLECYKWSWEQISTVEPRATSFEWDFKGEGVTECRIEATWTEIESTIRTAKIMVVLR